MHDVFGLTKFRANQETIIEKILQGQDVFVVMPTGGGKSICFQIPALIFDGITIVISPLISLMNEQVDRLQLLNIKAVFLNRSLTTGQVKKAMNDIVYGRYKIVYVAPERLESKLFVEFIEKVKISLVVVDEAHCVLQWGFGFRPSYLKISKFFANLQRVRPVFAAFTATVKLKSVTEIVNLLNLKNPYILVTGFARNNLCFNVFRVEEHLKLKFLFKMFKLLLNESTIIYCQTRKIVEFLYYVLYKKGFRVEKYHAGLSREARRRSQEKFLHDEVNVLVATNAFGMGIDKKNVRNVIHYNMPKNLEDYYQEAGRAGRDGKISNCFMLYSNHDVKINKFLIDKMKYCEYLTQSQIQRLKQSYYNSLHDIVKYCESDDCYVKQIVNYFGEKFETENCYCCGNCRRKFVDVTDMAIKIFDCVKYFSWECTFDLVVKILKGRIFINKRMKNYINYKALKKSSTKQIRKCLEELKNKGYLYENSSKKLNLTKKSINLLKHRNYKIYYKL